jgi:predicted protein tyrosine phosphatase
MAIFVCPMSQLKKVLKEHKPTSVVSILDPGSDFPKLGPAFSGRHLWLDFHDTVKSTSGSVMPTVIHVDRLLRFLNRWDPGKGLLIHCRAGIGRSPAVAFIAACYHNRHTDELEIASQIRRASPVARPNRALVGIADKAMSRNGRMNAAMEKTFRGLPRIHVMEGIPFQIPSIYPDTRE